MAIRNPDVTDSNGIPMCFTEYADFSDACQRCPDEIKERCIDEKAEEDKRDPDLVDSYLGKPRCYKKYSEYSTKCHKQCDFSDSCSKESETKRVDKFYLPVIKQTPSSIKNVYEYKPSTSNSNTFSYSSSTKSVFSTQNFDKKPYLSQEQAQELYGRRLHPNPIIDGQFEGESWYSRLVKEFVLKTTQHAIHVMGSLLIDMIGKVRWAPTDEED
jgi:hypothetical protein